jgi:hypothetical protein
MADLADRVPGFGGVYMRPDGSFDVVSAMPGRAVETTNAVDALLSERGITGPHRITVLPGRYNYRQLRDWKMRFATMAHHNIVRTGIDSRDNRFHVGVLDTATVVAIRADLNALGIPDSAVVLSIEKPRIELASLPVPTTTAGAPAFVQLLDSRVDPVRGGLGVSMSGTAAPARGPCTLTVVAVPQVLAPNAVPDYSGVRYGITTAHCTPVFGVNDGSVMGQPTTSVLDRIGQEVVDPPLFGNAFTPACPPNRRCRYSDAAQFALDAGVNAVVGTVYDAEHSPNPAIQGTPFNLTQTFAPFSGFSVRKVGLGAGGVNGTIGRTCFDQTLFAFQNGNSFDTGITLLCQYEFLGDGFFGDSGAPVFWLSNGQWNLIGVINSGDSGGSNTFSDWNFVWQELRQAWDSPPNRRLCPLVSPGTGCVFQ